jgi:deoxyribodipyrimidine photo-lyase
MTLCPSGVPLGVQHRARVRAFIQRTLRDHLRDLPSPEPLKGCMRAITDRWPAAAGALRSGEAAPLAGLPIDHGVPVSPIRGGAAEGARRLEAFLASGLVRYADDHSQPEANATSGLSPYLHFGHVAAHQVFSAVMTRERWTTRRLATSSRGARQGWWASARAPRRFSIR